MRLGPALLFCPGDRGDRFLKASAVSDIVIIDLEDAVAPASKEVARQTLLETPLDPSRTIIRVNSVRSGELEKDLSALSRTAYGTVMVPKSETAADFAELTGYDIVALCETPLGIRNAGQLASGHNVVALCWGAEDLVAAIGGRSSRKPNGEYRDVARYARSQVLAAAASEGKPAYDAVHLDFEDTTGLLGEAEDAAESGFAGAMCIHPRQVEVIRQAFRPTPETTEWARRLLDVAAKSSRGAFAFEGRMVDEPLIRQARRVLGVSD
jgi:citrate lyase subunit beta/citryl-CoA lyase